MSAEEIAIDPNDYESAVAAGLWTPPRGAAPGPSCPECLGLDVRLLPGSLAWLRCACGHEWRPAAGKGEVAPEVVDARGAEAADRRRGRA